MNDEWQEEHLLAKYEASKLVLKSAKFIKWLKENHPDYYKTYIENFINERKPTKKEKLLWKIWEKSL